MSRSARGVEARRRQRQPADGETLGPLGTSAGGDVGDLRAHHLGRHRAGRLDAGIAGADHAAGAQHRGALAEAPHVVEPVRDIEQCPPFGLQAVEDGKERFGFARRQHRGRLVEDHQLRILQQDAGDLDALALAGGQRPDRTRRLELQAVALRQAADAGHRARIGARAGSTRAMFSDTVRFSNSERMLEHHADAERPARLRASSARPGAPATGSRPRTAAAARRASSPASTCRRPFSPRRAWFSPTRTSRSMFWLALHGPEALRQAAHGDERRRGADGGRWLRAAPPSGHQDGRAGGFARFQRPDALPRPRPAGSGRGSRGGPRRIRSQVARSSVMLTSALRASPYRRRATDAWRTATPSWRAG